MPQNIYQAIWIFLIYSFLGWICEVSFAALEHGKFVNRGLLNGPVCPIYGLGMLLITALLYGLRRNVILLFLSAAVLTTALEFLAGWILEGLFNDKWWDYSNYPFNIKGYVCLKFSVTWGLSATFVIGAVHPFVYFLIQKTPFTAGLVLICLFGAVFIADLIITLVELLKLPRVLNAMLEFENLLEQLSDSIGGRVSDTTLIIREKGGGIIEETKPQFEEKKAALVAEFEKKRAEYINLLKKSNIMRRIFKAFPKLKTGRYKAVFERVGHLLSKPNKNDSQAPE